MQFLTEYDLCFPYFIVILRDKLLKNVKYYFWVLMGFIMKSTYFSRQFILFLESNSLAFLNCLKKLQ